MGKKKIFILLLIFLITLILTFPTKVVISYILSSNNFLFSKIDGNILNIQVKDLENKDLYIKNLSIINRFIYQKLDINKNLKIKYTPISKNLYFKFEDFNTEEIIKDNTLFSAKINGVINISKKNNFKLLEGDGEIFIKKMKLFAISFSGLKLEYNIEKEKDYSKVKAKLKSENIEGSFKGKIIWKDKINIDGSFSGEVFGREIDRKINEKFELKILDGLL